MKTRVQIALFGCIFSIFVHGYLTFHYYALKLGYAAGQSLCNVNEKFNCDAVSASTYSAFLGIPLSVWGMVVNVILFLMILISWLEWSDHPERVRRWAVLLSGLSAIASVVMGGVSLLLINNFCLFCILLYALSFVVFFCFKGTLREPFWMHLRTDIGSLWRESRAILIAFVSIPIFAFLVHKFFMQNTGDDAIKQIVNDALTDWAAAPKQDFVAKPSLVTGPPADRASLVLSEFADFRCGHCKHASYTLDAFVSAHPDVRFEFYNFPLDGACNEKIQQTDGVSCRVAAGIQCAEAEGKGWLLHKIMFEKQDDVLRSGGTAEVDVILNAEISKLGMNWERFSRCLSDAATLDTVKAQAKQGALVDVRGTPTIFANGRQLNGGQLLPVLQAARERSLSQK
jgi:uncharacterized membrane protein/protein-disulfide isomerase